MAKTPTYYPVFLDLYGKRCVIAGGGAVADGKIAKLLDAGARVTVISPEATAAIQTLAQDGSLEWQAREYQPGDLAGAALAIAATNVRSTNQLVTQEAETLGVLLNVVDAPSQCSFIAPSIVNRGPVTVAISTGGVSPALSRKIRESLAHSPALEWADLAGILSQARKRVKEQHAVIDPQRWQCSITSELLELVQAGREEEALATLLAKLLGDPPEADSQLCPEAARCLPQGCGQKPAERPAASEERREERQTSRRRRAGNHYPLSTQNRGSA
jgi:siroheme synthase-like protein